MVKAASKKGFRASSTKRPKKAIAKKAAVPSDPIEALIQKSKTALNVSEAEREEQKRKKTKKAQQAKARRSVVRKQQKQRKNGAKRKQARKGVN